MRPTYAGALIVDRQGTWLSKTRQLSWCIKVDRAWSPPICSQLVEDALDYSSRSALLSAMISIYLLSELQWERESLVLQAATEDRISYLEHLVLQKGYLLERSSEWLSFTSGLKARISSCKFPWVLGNIISWAEANILNVFDTILSEPLVPTYTHVYQHLRNENAVEEDPDLERLCQKSRHLLFWEGNRPCDSKAVETSFMRWIAVVDPESALRVVESRFGENLAFSIGCNRWCITQAIAKKHLLGKVDYLDSSFVSSLQVKLEEERQRIDTFALSECIRDALKESGVVAVTNSHEMQLWDMKNVPNAAVLFPLHYEYLSSCLEELCMGCKKRNGESLFSCGGCMYAKFCGKSCQKAIWPLHRQYCSPGLSR